MPNYNISIKSEFNFHKGDYKRSRRSGKAPFSYIIKDDDVDAAENMTQAHWFSSEIILSCFYSKYKCR